MEAILANEPEFRAFTVNSYGKGDERKDRWTEIGAAWRTKSGEGFRIILEALPINGQLILMPPKAREET